MLARLIDRRLVVLLLLVAPASAILADPPRVVKAVPDNGDSDVDPALKEIVIEFDQDMDPGGRSICGGGPSFPKFDGKPRWNSPRVLVIPVKLEPNRQYDLSINCPSAQNFTSTSGESAEIYPMTFKTSTASNKSKPAKLTPEQNKAALDMLRKAIDESYSYRDLRGVDWGKAFAEAEAGLLKSDSAAAFARCVGRLLAKAKDIHVSVLVGDAPVPVFRHNAKPNFDKDAASKAVPGFAQRNACVSTGKFDDGIGYILLPSWSLDCKEGLTAAFEALGEFTDAKALIVDVRPNGGGSETLAQEFAGCFAEKSVVYSKHRNRDVSQSDGFTAIRERVLEPNKARPHFKGKVAVLIGPTNMSSNESFILMMKQCGATLVGAKTYGSSGNPKPHELSNGVTVMLPSWQDMLPDGSPLEGKGVPPDVAVKAEAGDFKKGDPVIEAALKVLRKGE